MNNFSRYFSHPTTKIFLICLGITAVVWLLRGVGLLSFLSSAIIWILLFLTIGTGIVAGLQRAR